MNNLSIYLNQNISTIYEIEIQMCEISFLKIGHI